MIEVLPTRDGLPPQRVILVSHGLNNAAVLLDAMVALIAPDTAIVVKLTLSGHAPGQRIGPAAWDEIWIEDMLGAITVAEELARRHGVPLGFLGFSTSCVIFLAALERARVPFDRLVLLSPPLTMRFRYRLTSMLGSLGVRAIPSLNRASYRVHRFLPISMYAALFRLIDRIRTLEIGPRCAGLVLLDPRDPLVDVDALVLWMTRQSATWELIPVLGDQRPLSPMSHLLQVRSEAGESAYTLTRELVARAFTNVGAITDGQLALTPYEHFFLNEQNDEYPISILLRLRIHGRLARDRFAEALGECQRHHPLLRARINGAGIQRRQNLQWVVLASDYTPYIDWHDGSMPENFPHDRREIDLRSEVGVRAFVRVLANETIVTLQVHHACLDGIGAMRFIQSLLSFYRAPSAAPPAPIVDLARRQLAPSPRLVDWLADLRLLRKFGAFPARPIAAGRRPPGGSVANTTWGRIAQHELDRDAVRALTRRARKLGVTVNDLITAALGKSIRSWNRVHGEATEVRITLPFNLRSPEQASLSACNVTGMYFVDFAAERDATEVHGELERVKRERRALAFQRFVTLAGSVPYGIAAMNRAPTSANRAATSTCISNLGVVDAWRTALAAELAGVGMTLVDVFGCAPLRPGTRMTFCFTTANDVMMITALADPRYFVESDVQQFLNDFASLLRDGGRGQEEVGRADPSEPDFPGIGVDADRIRRGA